MVILCKVCDSDKREYIEELILQGNSNKAVSETLKAIGVNISHASINRHKENHMKENEEIIKKVTHEKCNRKYNLDDSETGFAIDATALFSEIESDIAKPLSYTEFAETNKKVMVLLNRILSNQLAITIAMQEKYMSGKAKYPNEQIRGLQIINEISLKFDESTRKTFNHLKTIMNSDDMMSIHIQNIGYKAKQELDKNNPYHKGALFKILFNQKDYCIYEENYNPNNPYSYSENNMEYTAFHYGIKKARMLDEELDNILYNLIKNYKEKKPKYDMEGKIKELAFNEYDANCEIATIRNL
jgi:hypothetical protein